MYIVNVSFHDCGMSAVCHILLSIAVSLVIAIGRIFCRCDFEIPIGPGLPVFIFLSIACMRVSVIGDVCSWSILSSSIDVGWLFVLARNHVSVCVVLFWSKLAA